MASAQFRVFRLSCFVRRSRNIRSRPGRCVESYTPARKGPVPGAASRLIARRRLRPQEATKAKRNPRADRIFVMVPPGYDVLEEFSGLSGCSVRGLTVALSRERRERAPDESLLPESHDRRLECSGVETVRARPAGGAPIAGCSAMLYGSSNAASSRTTTLTEGFDVRISSCRARRGGFEPA